LTKLVVEKVNKGFDKAKCWLINDALGNEFLGYFPFGNDSFLGISINVHRFKRAPPNIVYYLLSDIHKNEIKNKITQYNKFDTKMPIFAIPKDLHNADHITLHKLNKWVHIQDSQYLIINKQYTIVIAKVH
jgi:hypothetical protein